MFDRMHSQVKSFLTTIIGLVVPDKPTPLHPLRKEYAYNHLMEEISEFRDSSTTEEMADALVDIVYVAMGRLVEMGLQPGPLFDEVHAANMRKRLGRTKRGDVGHDAVKPDDWVGPDIEKYLTLTHEDLDWLIEIKEFNPNIPITMISPAYAADALRGLDECHHPMAEQRHPMPGLITLEVRETFTPVKDKTYTLNPKDATEAILSEREKTHGTFAINSPVMQALKGVARKAAKWDSMTPSQREAVDMICHKLGRILTGNPGFHDHWADIAGYARLVEKECPR